MALRDFFNTEVRPIQLGYKTEAKRGRQHILRLERGQDIHSTKRRQNENAITARLLQQEAILELCTNTTSQEVNT